MNSLAIEKILSKTLGKTFKGVFSFDEWRSIPKLNPPAAIVFNTQPITQPVGHWIAIFIEKNGKAIFFDSFARSPTELGFDTFLRKHSSSWTYNNVLVQNPMTLVCGQHVIVFLLIVSTRGKSAWIKLFSSDLISNDDFVYSTINQIFHTNTSFYPVGDFIM